MTDEDVVRLVDTVHLSVLPYADGYRRMGREDVLVRVTSVCDAVGSKEALIQWAENK